MNPLFFYTPANIINNSFFTYIMVLFAFFGEPELSAEIAVFISIIFLFTQLFSANMRNIIFTENNRDLLQKVKIFRIIFFLPIFIISNLIFILISNNYNHLIICLSILILLSWINEMNILDQELNKKIKKTIYYLSINIFLLILVTIFVITGNNEKIISLFYFQILFCIGIFFKIKDYKISNIKLFINSENIKKIQSYNFAFFSSFSMIVANFLSRVIIFGNIEKSLAGIIFAAFSIGSFPGTIFNNTFGPTLVKNKFKLNKFFILLLAFIFLILLFLILYLFYRFDDFTHELYILIFTSLISLVGSFSMVYSLYLRQSILNISTGYHDKVFKYDIILNILLVFLTIIICIINSNIFYFLFFFIFSLISLIVYKYMNKKISNG